MKQCGDEYPLSVAILDSPVYNGDIMGRVLVCDIMPHISNHLTLLVIFDVDIMGGFEIRKKGRSVESFA